MPKPTIFVVSGAYHAPEHYEKLKTHLETAGYGCKFASPRYSNPVNGQYAQSMDEEIEAVREPIVKELEIGNNVVVATHSMGAVLGCAAMSGLDEKSRSGTGKTSHVVGVVCLAGTFLPAGYTVTELGGGEVTPAYYAIEGETSFARPEKVTQMYYHDVPEEEQQRYKDLLRPMTLGMWNWRLPDTVTPIKSIPVSYLLCRQDQAWPYTIQESNVKMLSDAGIKVHAEVANSSHSPFASLPQQTAAFVRNAAGENIETGFDKHI